MDFRNENTVTTKIAEFITNSAMSLHLTTKYVYALSYESFYKCDIKDLLKVVLNNMFQPELISVLNIQVTDPYCAPMDTREYDDMIALIMYSFAVRLPILEKMEIAGLSERQIRSVYKKVLKNGAENHKNVVDESFDSIYNLVKQGSVLPAYQSNWYKLYLYENIPEFVEINNRNMFFLGAVDILFTMFYLHMQEDLKKYIKQLSLDSTI